METNRLEAFSDGVLAIIITIMVLELKLPHGAQLASLTSLMPVFSSYVLSFIYVGIYWNNHHHLFHAARRVSAGILWANLHLLFWLSLFPFATAWMGENRAAPAPTAVYGVVLLSAAIAYYILQCAIIAREGRHSLLALALGRDWKGKLCRRSTWPRSRSRSSVHGWLMGCMLSLPSSGWFPTAVSNALCKPMSMPGRISIERETSLRATEPSTALSRARESWRAAVEPRGAMVVNLRVQRCHPRSARPAGHAGDIPHVI